MAVEWAGAESRFCAPFPCLAVCVKVMEADWGARFDLLQTKCM